MQQHCLWHRRCNFLWMTPSPAPVSQQPLLHRPPGGSIGQNSKWPQASPHPYMIHFHENSLAFLALHSLLGQAASAVTAALAWPSEQLASPSLPFRFSWQESFTRLWCPLTLLLMHQTCWMIPRSPLLLTLHERQEPSPFPWQEQDSQPGHTLSFAQYLSISTFNSCFKDVGKYV